MLSFSVTGSSVVALSDRLAGGLVASPQLLSSGPCSTHCAESLVELDSCDGCDVELRRFLNALRVTPIGGYVCTFRAAGDEEAFGFEEGVCLGHGARSDLKVRGQLTDGRQALRCFQLPRQDEISNLHANLLEGRHGAGGIDADHEAAPGATITGVAPQCACSLAEAPGRGEWQE